MRKFFFGVICSVLLIACDNKTDSATGNEPASVSSTDKKPATEVLDLKEADGVKASFAALSKGDVDAMLTNYADDAVHYWSGGDSAAGKTAIADYWKGRWKLIDSLTFSETIVLPIRINESQSPQYASPGKWVLAWTFSHVKYKNGKKLDFWAHTDYYFNEAGKVASVIQYIDRAPIMEATKGIVVK
jgi:hypothetical protein